MITPLLPLIGTWGGDGLAVYPPYDDAHYNEVFICRTDDKHSLLQYEQKTYRAEELSLLAWEFGFIRPNENGTFDMVNTQNNGRVEVLKGRVSEDEGLWTLSLESVMYGNDTKMIHARRLMQIEGDRLRYTMMIASHANPTPFTHLKATLFRDR